MGAAPKLQLPPLPGAPANPNPTLTGDAYAQQAMLAKLRRRGQGLGSTFTGTASPPSALGST